MYKATRKRLEDCGIPYKEIISGTTRRIFVKGLEIANYDNSMTGAELGFISRIRRHVEKQNPLNIHGAIQYIKISEARPGVYKNMVEIDVSSAYWHAALFNNTINKKLFKAGQKTTKKARLISLGSLARTVSIFEFDGKDLHLISEDYDSELASHFWGAAQRVDRLFLELMQSSGALFYWVDAFFLDANKLEYVKERFKEAGYPYKIKYIKEIEIVNNTLQRKATVTHFDGTEKIYTFAPKKKTRQYKAASKRKALEFLRHINELK